MVEHLPQLGHRDSIDLLRPQSRQALVHLQVLASQPLEQMQR